MIVLMKLKWNNCFTYGDNNSLILNDAGLTQIVGANGAGKSSIPVLIEEVLFNKNSRNIKKADIVNRNTKDSKYLVELDFSVDKDQYKVIVARSKTLKVTLSKNGKDISSHTATNTFKTIEELLGLDFKTFSQLVYQNTNSSLQFLTATDTTRKRFLIDLLDLSKYVEYFEIFKNLAKDYNSKIVALDSKINTCKKWLDSNKLDSMEVLKPQKIEISVEEDLKELSFLQGEFENISQKNQKISKNNLFKSQLAGINLQEFSDLKKLEIRGYDDLVEELGALKSSKDSATKELMKLKKLGDNCPTCTQPVDKGFIETLKKQHLLEIQMADEQSHVINTEITRLKEHNTKVRKKLKAENDWQSLYKAIDPDLQEEPLNAETLQSSIKAIQETVRKKKKEIEDIIAENTRIEKNNTRIAVIQEQTEKINEELRKASVDLDEISEITTKLEILKKAFSTNGLIAYKIEYLIKELESLVNDYLLDMSDGRFSINFIVNKDKLNVVITDNGKEVEITSLSSGECARVTTSTLLAIRKLMNSISKSRINVLFLDEVISTLDYAGRERLVDVLVKEDKLNTFVVSHEWTHPLLNKLSIVKENNISRVE